jgi:hypothetical protein
MSPNQDRRKFLKTLGGAGAGLAASALVNRAQDAERPGRGPSAAALTAPALDVVRMGLIGVGSRGTDHLGTLLKLDGVEVNAICDIHQPTAKKAAARCTKAGRPRPELYTGGDLDYRRMLEREDLDVILISTPWRGHTPQAVDTMKAGKHALVEVPAAVTIDECWQLVDTCEQTRKYCMMLENVCYGREELLALNMCRHGLFGELLHGEAAYIHDLRKQMKQVDRGTGSWRTRHHETRNGNLYPTHGLGPIAQYMNINRGDRFDYLVSMSSPALGRQLYARETFPAGHARNRATYICGDMNTSLIKTTLGRTIMVQHDTTTPRPYSRLNFIQGTKGAFGGFPNRIVVEGRGSTHDWGELKAYYEEFEHPLWKAQGEAAEKAGGHGGMDFLMLWRTIYCLRNGEPLDQDVYDAASWSSVGPASEMSVAGRSRSVDMPDFTRGAWKTNKPLGIVG